jgi:hypothetical protein
MLNYFGRRYVDATAFQGEIRRLRIYRTYVGDHLLQQLERARLIIPKLRIRYPDPIARRWWHEMYPEFGRVLVHRRIRPIHLIAGTQAGDQRPFRVTASG